MSQIELKPCPFCGGAAFMVQECTHAQCLTPGCCVGPVSGLDSWNARAPQWQPIESAPEDGKCLVAVETDDGWWYGQLERDKRGNWIHEGEPTYCKSYYFNPHSWQPLPAPPEVSP